MAGLGRERERESVTEYEGVEKWHRGRKREKGIPLIEFIDYLFFVRVDEPDNTPDGRDSNTFDREKRPLALPHEEERL